MAQDSLTLPSSPRWRWRLHLRLKSVTTVEVPWYHKAEGYSNTHLFAVVIAQTSSFLIHTTPLSSSTATTNFELYYSFYFARILSHTLLVSFILQLYLARGNILINVARGSILVPCSKPAIDVRNLFVHVSLEFVLLDNDCQYRHYSLARAPGNGMQWTFASWYCGLHVARYFCYSVIPPRAEDMSSITLECYYYTRLPCQTATT